VELPLRRAAPSRRNPAQAVRERSLPILTHKFAGEENEEAGANLRASNLSAGN
jgi:hypothetical protein